MVFLYELYQYTNDKLKRSTLTAFLQIKRHDVISFAGAGGKTSTIFALAEEIKNNTDYRVLVTTTTKMFLEKEAITLTDENFIMTQLRKKQIVIAGTNLGKKMGCFNMDFLQKIISYSDITLIEADGAKRKPFKMPRVYEPVYLSRTTKIVYLVGMLAWGKKIRDLSRADILTEFLYKSLDERLTEEDMIKVLLSKLGAKKDVQDKLFCIILNQVDDENILKIAMKIAMVLNRWGIRTAISKHY